jgi:hypothetical protein
MKGEPAPVCIYTIKHILLDCVDFADATKLFHIEIDMFNLFGKVKREKILDFIREIGPYKQI